VAVPVVEQVAGVVEIVGVLGAPKTGLVEKLVAPDVHEPFPAVIAYVVPAVIPVIKPPLPTEGPAGLNT
jgi:Na+-transporting methylmalonyl-CoA/oxaloacetate decarboxylase beta subunit